jgi:hypothetical protein
LNPIQILNIARPNLAGTSPSANGGAAANGSAVGSIIILTSFLLNYQTVLVDLNPQNRCLEKLIRCGGVLKNTSNS